jgi:hypothetical protein
VIPTNVPDPQAYGKVLSVGENVPDTISKGDIIVCHLNAGMDMIMEKNLMRTLKYGEVYGILKDKSLIENLEEMVIQGSSEGVQIASPSQPLIQPARG